MQDLKMGATLLMRQTSGTAEYAGRLMEGINYRDFYYERNEWSAKRWAKDGNNGKEETMKKRRLRKVSMPWFFVQDRPSADAYASSEIFVPPCDEDAGLSLLLKGNTFLKFSHGYKRPHFRFFRLSPNQQYLQEFILKHPVRRRHVFDPVDLSRVLEIRLGQNTRTFDKYCDVGAEDLSFSLLWLKKDEGSSCLVKSLDLVARSPSHFQMWVHMLKVLCSRLNPEMEDRFMEVGTVGGAEIHHHVSNIQKVYRGKSARKDLQAKKEARAAAKRPKPRLLKYTGHLSRLGRQVGAYTVTAKFERYAKKVTMDIYYQGTATYHQPDSVFSWDLETGELINKTNMKWSGALVPTADHDGLGQMQFTNPGNDIIVLIVEPDELLSPAAGSPQLIGAGASPPSSPSPSPQRFPNRFIPNQAVEQAPVPDAAGKRAKAIVQQLEEEVLLNEGDGEVFTKFTVAGAKVQVMLRAVPKGTAKAIQRDVQSAPQLPGTAQSPATAQLNWLEKKMGIIQ